MEGPESENTDLRSSVCIDGMVNEIKAWEQIRANTFFHIPVPPHSFKPCDQVAPNVRLLVTHNTAASGTSVVGCHPPAEGVGLRGQSVKTHQIWRTKIHYDTL